MNIPTPGQRAKAMPAPSDVTGPQFSHAQLVWLRKRFPYRVYPPTTDASEMHNYFGAQSVLSAIEKQMQAHAVRG